MGQVDFEEQRYDDLIGVICTKCIQKNVIILGDSRTGKSTYKELLMNRSFTTDNNVFRSTDKPISESLHAQFRGKSMNITFIDTPGFNELSGDSINRNDRAIQEEISSFLKNDIAYVNLVLIAVDAAVGLNQAQIKSICETLNFLKGFSAAAAILVTHFDLSGPEDELNWINQFKANQKLKVINGVVKNRFLFTGALQKSLAENNAVKDKYLRLQGQRIAKFFELMEVSEPVYLINKDESATISVKESAKNSHNNLVCLPGLNKELEKKIIEARLQLGALLESEGESDEYLKANGKRIKILLNRYSRIGTESYKINEPSRDVVESITKYSEIEDEISKQSWKCCKQYDELNLVFQNLENEILGYEINRKTCKQIVPENIEDDFIDFSEITDDTEQ